MKRFSLVVLLAVAILAGSGTAWGALDVLAGDKISLTDWYGNFPGGAFKALVWNPNGTAKIDVDTGSQMSFYTFCTETTQTITLGTAKYTVDSLTVAASPSQKYGDWAYAQFLINHPHDVQRPDYWGQYTGPMADNSTYSNQASALQYLVWTSIAGYSTGNSYVQGVADEYAVYGANWSAGFAAAGGVSGWTGITRTVQLSLNGVAVQDQLVLLPGDLTQGSVPEPATIVIWSLLGVGSAGWSMFWHRRRKGVAAGWSEENRQAIHAIIAHGRSRA